MKHWGIDMLSTFCMPVIFFPLIYGFVFVTPFVI